MLEDQVEISRGEAGIGAHAVDEPPVLAAHIDDQGLTGGELWIDHQCAGFHPVLVQEFGRELAEDVVADSARTAAVIPRRARSTAVLAAPPPTFKTSSSTAISSPALGR